VLAFDQYHDDQGTPIGPKTTRRAKGTNLYVSNTYARSLVRRHREALLLGASIHPYRRHEGRSACEFLEEVVGAGAVLIKWLPVVQNIDAEDPRTVAFLEKAHDLDIPLLIHYGGEATLGRPHPEFENPVPLLGVLRGLRASGKMPTIIVAHAATPVGWPCGNSAYYRALTEALTGEFRDAPLYADTAALALFSRARWLKRLARRREIHEKLVYGSDFPIPVTPIWFWRFLGRRLPRVLGMPSWIDRDVAIKQALGFGDDFFERSGRILARRIAYADKLTTI